MTGCPILWLFLCASLAYAQDIPRAGESIEVSIVNVDVFVTDRSGRHVTGLTKDDFEIFEDGKLQPITNFAEYRSNLENESVSVEGTASERTAAPQPPPRPHRTLVVFVDRFQGFGERNGEKVFSELKDLLHQTVRPGDSVTIVSWVHRLFTRLPFSDDLAAIDRVLDKMAKETNYEMRGDYTQIEEQQLFEEEAEAFIAGVPGSQGAAPPASGDHAPAGGVMPTLEQLSAATDELHDMQAKTRAMKALIQSISGLEGQKSMIFVSRKFSAIAGQQYLTDRHVLNGPQGLYEHLNDMTAKIESVARTANANGVTMYMLYPAGLDTNAFVQDPSNRRMPRASEPTAAGHAYQALLNETAALSYVAEQTGGLSASGPDVIKLLPRIEEDFSSYYSLAYHATTHRQDRSRKIVVKMKNRELTVRARRQFIEQSDETKMNNRVVASLFAKTGEDAHIPVEVRIGKPKAKGKGIWALPVVIEVPARALLTLPDAKGQRGAFSVYIAWGDILGAVSEVTHRTVPFSMEDVKRAKREKFGYQFEMLTDMKTNRIAVGVYDEVAKEYGLARVVLPRSVAAE